MRENTIQAVAIQKSLELSEQEALKVLVFIAGMEAGRGLQVPCIARQGNPQETKNYVLGVAEGMEIAKEKQQARQFQEA